MSVDSNDNQSQSQSNASPDDLKAIEKLGTARQTLKTEIAKVIVGQQEVVDDLLTAIFSRGHCLMIGVPGLAKTLMVSTIAAAIDLDFNRIQFTPDLMPSDITGTEIIEEDKSTGGREFKFVRGPVFANILLADEINRTPPKTQASLLQAMQELEVTVGGQTYQLPRPFFVLATQNPIEQEGTYPLPEAQLDRFLMHVNIDYPDAVSERHILQLVRNEALTNEAGTPATQVAQDLIFTCRKELLNLHMAPVVEEYIVQLTMATRNPASYGDDLANWIDYGASPRGTIALDICARANAFLLGKDFVTPDDVQSVLHDVFRHRIIVSFEAEAMGIDADRILDILVQRVAAA